MKIVIVGNGIAGNQVAFSLRKNNFNGEITIISAEKFPEYDPCALPYFISGEISREVIFRKKIEDYKTNNIQLILNNKAVSVNPKTQKVITEKGDEFKYDKLILAYGGDLFIPNINGIKNKKGIFNCKQLFDADKLNSSKGKIAVVIGSGAIGIEVAEALKRKGYDVSVIELLDRIMPTMFDKSASKLLEKALNNYGIKIYTNEKVISIEGNKNVTGVTTNKRKIICDTVVLAAGVVINKTLPLSAGIKTDRGIIVNEKLQTNIKNIYACGDCAETIDAFDERRCNYQLKHNAIEQADIIAQNIMGNNICYSGAYSFARAHFFQTHASSFGKTINSLKEKKDIEIIERKDNDNYLKVILKSGKVIGAQAIGKYADNMGLLLSSMWQQNNIKELKNNWENISLINSPYPWTYRKLGYLLGFRHSKSKKS